MRRGVVRSFWREKIEHDAGTIARMPGATASSRLIYQGPTRLLPEITMAGYDHFQHAGVLPGHVHREAFEICLIVAGAVDWWAGDELCEVRGGDLFVTRPGERHGGVDAVMNPCELYWFHVAFSRRKPLPGMSASESNNLHRRLSGFSIRSFRASDATRRACVALHQEHARADDLARLTARAALHAMLAGVLRDHESALRRRREISAPVREAMRFMSDNLAEPFRIDAAATVAGISVGRLHARFLAETGLTPGDWRLRQSIARAKALLRNTDQSVTSIALDLGFSSSQYFATAFRRVTGLTPIAYRATRAG